MSILKLSVSKAKTFSDCKAKYKFTYIEKLPRKDREWFVFGKFIHKILEDFHQLYIDGCTEQFNVIMGKCFKGSLEYYSPKITNDMKKEGYEIIDNYLKIIYNDKNSVKNVLAVEKEFNFNITDNVILNGMIDRIEQNDDGSITVADYKTTKNKQFLKNDFLQLLTYAYVVLSENPDLKKIRGAYILVRHNFDRIEKNFDIEEIMEIKNKYEDYAKNIEEEQLWRPNPTNLCKFCEFLEHCEAGQKQGRSNYSGKTGW